MTVGSLKYACAALALLAFSTPSDARGRCDGFHGCRCGVTAARRNGLPLNYQGYNLKQAVEWVRAFPRTVFQSGVVGYIRHGGPTGHVFTVEGGSSCSAARVYDDRGAYTRNVCNATFVAVHGSSAVAPSRTSSTHNQQKTAVRVTMACDINSGRCAL